MQNRECGASAWINYLKKRETEQIKGRKHNNKFTKRLGHKMLSTCFCASACIC